MKVDEQVLHIVERVKSITLGDYPIYWKFKNYDGIDGYIDSESLLGMSIDLLSEIDYLHELIEEMKKPKDKYDDYDAHDRWLDNQNGVN